MDATDADRWWTAQAVASIELVTRELAVLGLHERHTGGTARDFVGTEFTLELLPGASGTHLDIGIHPGHDEAAVLAGIEERLVPIGGLSARPTPLAANVAPTLPSPPTVPSPATATPAPPAPPLPPVPPPPAAVPPPPPPDGTAAGAARLDDPRPTTARESATPGGKTPTSVPVLVSLLTFALGALLLVGAGLEIEQYAKYDAAQAWTSNLPTLALGLLVLLAAIDGFRGSRAGVVVSTFIVAVLTLASGVLLMVMRLLIDLATSLGSTVDLGPTLTIWMVAIWLGALLAIVGLVIGLRDQPEAPVSPTVSLVTVLLGGAFLAGSLGLPSGHPNFDFLQTTDPWALGINIALTGLVPGTALLAAFRRSAGAYGLLTGVTAFFALAAVRSAVSVLSHHSASVSGYAIDVGAMFAAAGLMTAIGGFAVVRAQQAQRQPTSWAAALAVPIGVIALAAAAVVVFHDGTAGYVASGSSSFDQSGSSSTYARSSSSHEATSHSTSDYGSSSGGHDEDDRDGTDISRRSTTTTWPSTTTTTARRPSTTTVVRFTLHSSCLQRCRIYLRHDPYEDLSQPGTSYYIDGDVVEVVCQTRGQEVHDSDTGRTSDAWDQVRSPDGLRYVSDIYVDASDSNVPAC